MSDYNLFIDIKNKQLVLDYFSRQITTAPDFFFGDESLVSVTGLEPNTGADRDATPWKMVDMAGKRFDISIGTTNRQPSAGEWQILAGTVLDYNAEAVDVEAALNADATISGEGGVDVVGIAGSGVFTVTYRTDGTKTAMSATLNSLLPTSDIFINTVREGATGITKVVQINLETASSAYAELSTDIPAPVVTLTDVQTGDAVNGTPHIYRVTTDAPSYGGTFSIADTAGSAASISYAADKFEIEEALATITSIADAALVTVDGDAGDFTVTLDATLGDMSGFTVDDTNLTALNGKQGLFSTNTVEMTQLLSGQAAEDALFEIVFYDTIDSRGATVFQGACEIKQDIIPSTPPSITPIPEYADKNHTHVIADVTGLQAEVDQIATNTSDIATNTADILLRPESGTIDNADIAAAAGIAKSKLEGVTDMHVLGNTSGIATTPQEVEILDEDDMVSDSDTKLATQQSIKAYTDAHGIEQTTGTAPYYGCRAWAHYNMVTDVVEASGNIASITRTSNGRCDVVFTNAMPSAFYSIALANTGDVNGESTIGFIEGTPTASGFSLKFIATNAGQTANQTVASFSIFA